MNDKEKILQLESELTQERLARIKDMIELRKSMFEVEKLKAQLDLDHLYKTFKQQEELVEIAINALKSDSSQPEVE